MSNIYEPEFDEPRDHDGFRAGSSSPARWFAFRPGKSERKHYFRIDDEVDYWEGETP